MNNKPTQADEGTLSSTNNPIDQLIVPRVASETLTIHSPSITINISPSLGGSIASLHFFSAARNRWIAIMPDSPEPLLSSSAASSFIMAPYSNRIRDGKFSVSGVEYQLKHSEKHAIHGDVRDRPWEVIEQSPSSVSLRFDSRNHADINFPFPFSATTIMQVDEASFSQRLTLTNLADVPMPAGFGFHPYFNRSLTAPNEEVIAQFTCAAVYPHEGSLPIPIGDAIPLSPTLSYATARPLEPGLDHCFRDWDRTSTFSWPSSQIRMTISASPHLSHLIVYTPVDSPLFAFEPATHAIDSINLAARGIEGTGTKLLQPGESFEGKWSLKLSEFDQLG